MTTACEQPPESKTGISYALVSYIPDPLGQYLDSIRQDLVPGCRLRSHVSILPPRPLASEEEAQAAIQTWASRYPAFHLELTHIHIFEKTQVVFIEVGAGREALVQGHDYLNSNGLRHQETYPFYPHLTLAQDFGAGQLSDIAERAARLWAACPFERRFLLDRVTFVRSAGENAWIDLAESRLAR